MILLVLIAFSVAIIATGVVIGNVEGADIAVVGIAGAIIFSLIAAVSWFIQLGHVESATEIENRIVIAEQELDAISAIVASELTSYPEFEREAYETFIEAGDPMILLAYPELRSNSVVIEAAERYSVATTRVFDEQRDLEARYRALRWHRNNPFTVSIGIDFPEEMYR